MALQERDNMHKYQAQTARTYRIDKDMLPGIELAAERLKMSVNQFANIALGQMVIQTLADKGEGK